MEQAIAGILSGDLDTVSLLMLFIVGLLTKRFVPWWVHEDVVEKLQEYEDAAPKLIDEVTTTRELMLELARQRDSGDNDTRIRDQVARINDRQEVLKNALPRRRRRRT